MDNMIATLQAGVASAEEALDTDLDKYASFETAIEMLQSEAVFAPVAAGLVSNALDGAQFFKCSKCDQKYQTERGLKRHMSLDHPG